MPLISIVGCSFFSSLRSDRRKHCEKSIRAIFGSMIQKSPCIPDKNRLFYILLHLCNILRSFAHRVMAYLSLVKPLSHLREAQEHPDEVVLESVGVSFQRGAVSE